MISRMEQKRHTRAEVLDAARRVIARQGFAETTARDVAMEAGVAVGTVFLHFSSMGLLAETILDETVGPALERAMSEGTGGDIVDRLVCVANALYDAYDAEPELARQVIAGSLFESAQGSPSRVRMAQFGEWVAGEVAEAVRGKRIPAIDPQQAFLSYFAIYFGGLVAGLRGELDRDGQLAVVRAALDRLFLTTTRTAAGAAKGVAS